MKSTPRSRARCRVASDSASSAGPYEPDIPQQPRPIAETGTPLAPNALRFMVIPRTRTVYRRNSGPLSYQGPVGPGMARAREAPAALRLRDAVGAGETRMASLLAVDLGLRTG